MSSFYGVDEKDRPHDIYEPAYYHIIKCKECNKQSQVCRRYTRLCDACRGVQIRRPIYDNYDQIQTGWAFKPKRRKVL